MERAKPYLDDIILWSPYITINTLQIMKQNVLVACTLLSVDRVNTEYNIVATQLLGRVAN